MPPCRPRKTRSSRKLDLDSELEALFPGMQINWSRRYLNSKFYTELKEFEKNMEFSFGDDEEADPTHPCLQQARVHLNDADLWRAFNEKTNEMTVNKEGRKLFPKLSISIDGLHPLAAYHVYLDFEVVGEKKYKYHYQPTGSKWVENGAAEKWTPGEKYYHSIAPLGSPSSGAQLMNKQIEFDQMKLTNQGDNLSSQRNNRSHIYMKLNSLHRYRPRIHLQVVLDQYGVAIDPIKYETEQVYTFDETEFIAVTAYHNREVRLLKIRENPYAKGFRDGPKEDETVPSGSDTSVYNPQSYYPPPIEYYSYPNCIKEESMLEVRSSCRYGDEENRSYANESHTSAMYHSYLCPNPQLMSASTICPATINRIVQ